MNKSSPQGANLSCSQCYIVHSLAAATSCDTNGRVASLLDFREFSVGNKRNLKLSPKHKSDFSRVYQRQQNFNLSFCEKQELVVLLDHVQETDFFDGDTFCQNQSKRARLQK